jgi:hypothetical protein
VVKEESLTARRNPDLLSSSLKVDLGVTTIPAPHAGRAGFGAVNQILPLPDLVNLLLEGDDFEFAQASDQFESLHVQGPKAGVVKPLGHHSERVTHEHLIHSVAREICRGQLDVIPGFLRGDGEDVIFSVNHQVVRVEHRQGERVKPEKPE